MREAAFLPVVQSWPWHSEMTDKKYGTVFLESKIWRIRSKFYSQFNVRFR